jgi:hypothetical protein
MHGSPAKLALDFPGRTFAIKKFEDEGLFLTFFESRG